MIEIHWLTFSAVMLIAAGIGAIAGLRRSNRKLREAGKLIDEASVLLKDFSSLVEIRQERLGREFETVLHNNRWDLYSKENK